MYIKKYHFILFSCGDVPIRWNNEWTYICWM